MSKTKWAVAVVSLLVSASALAQSSPRRTVPLPSVDISRLDVNPGGEDSLFNGTGRINEQGTLRVSVSALYLNMPSVTRLGKGTADARLSSRTSLIAAASWTPIEFLQLYGAAPYVLNQGEMSSLSRLGFRQVDVAGGTQPLLGARAAIWRQQAGAPVNLALGVETTLPVGDELALGQDELPRFQPNLSFGRELGDLTVGLQAKVRFRDQENFAFRGLEPLNNQGDTVTHELNGGLTLSYKVMEKLRANLDVIGDVSLKGGASGGGTLQPFLSARYQLLEGMEAYAAVGGGFGKLVGTARHQVFAGVSFTNLGGQTTKVIEKQVVVEEKKPVEKLSQDLDNDGILNRADACPTKAEDKDNHQDDDGCPDEDNDEDKVPDSKDACPDQKGAPENAGCPAKDSDGDGVADVADRCPNEKGTQAEGGCPIKDTDADGVRDEQDLCPNEAGDKERRGCPMKDTDGDGVSDEMDNCVREKGTADNAGCPPKVRQLVTITREKLVISDKVYFTPGKSTIMPRSRVLLDQVAKILKEHPELGKIRVEGHTDNVGIPDKNLKLSDERANAVKEYLVKAGVPADKLESKGYGQEKPIADNNTAQGRESNRRVEFVIVDAPEKREESLVPEPLTP